MFSPIIRSSRLFLIATLAVFPWLHASAQPTPGVDRSTDMMVSATVDHLPQDIAEVWLVRMVIQPGARFPMIQQPGPTLLAVESGNVTITTDSPVIRVSDTHSLPSSPAVSGAGDTSLTVGEGVSSPVGAKLEVRNDGEQVAEVLMLAVFAAGQGMQLVTEDIPSPEPRGWSVGPVAIGVATFANARGILIIERDVVPPNASAYSSTFNGIEIGVVEQGSARVTYQSGTGLHVPGVRATPGGSANAEPVQIPEGVMADLAAGDGYTARGASLTWRAGTEEPLVVLRAQVVPMPTPA